MAEVNSMPDMGDFPSETPPRSGRRLRWFLLIKLLLTVFLVYYVVNKIQMTEIRAEFSDVRWPFLLGGLALTAPNILIQYLKWRYLVRIVEPAAPPGQVFGSLMCGFSMGLITPGRLGEVGRGFFIPNASRSRLTGMAIIDKVLSQWALALAGLFSLTYLLIDEKERSPVMEWLCVILAALFVAFTLVLLLRPVVLRTLIRSSKRALVLLPYRQKLFDLVSASDEFRRGHFLPSLTYAIVFQLIVFSQFYFFINAFTTLPLFDALIASSAAMFIKSLIPVALMDLGVREGAVVYFFGLLGSSYAAAFNSSILIFLSNVLLPGALGLYFLVKHNFGTAHER